MPEQGREWPKQASATLARRKSLCKAQKCEEAQKYEKVARCNWEIKFVGVVGAEMGKGSRGLVSKGFECQPLPKKNARPRSVGFGSVGDRKYS